jgi:hypothetical protein
MLMQNANECVNIVVKHLKKSGVSVNKNYEKVKKTERDFLSTHATGINQIYLLLEKVEHYEEALVSQPNS